MATQEAVTRITAYAGADLSAEANMYKFVEGNQNSVTVCNADTDFAMGILESLGPSGSPVSVAVAGIGKLRLSGIIAAEVLIAPDTDGRGKAAAAGDRYRCITMEASTAAGDIVSVRLVDGNNLIA